MVPGVARPAIKTAISISATLPPDCSFHGSVLDFRDDGFQLGVPSSEFLRLFEERVTVKLLDFQALFVSRRDVGKWQIIQYFHGAQEDHGIL